MPLRSAREPRKDRQVARGRGTRATGERIVEAFPARLMTYWFDEITLSAVASDAVVPAQMIVRRFGGKDGLLAGAVRVLDAPIDTHRASPPESGVNRVVGHLLDQLPSPPRHLARVRAEAGRTRGRKEVAALVAA